MCRASVESPSRPPHLTDSSYGHSAQRAFQEWGRQNFFCPLTCSVLAMETAGPPTPLWRLDPSYHVHPSRENTTVVCVPPKSRVVAFRPRSTMRRNFISVSAATALKNSKFVDCRWSLKV